MTITVQGYDPCNWQLEQITQYQQRTISHWQSLTVITVDGLAGITNFSLQSACFQVARTLCRSFLSPTFPFHPSLISISPFPSSPLVHPLQCEQHWVCPPPFSGALHASSTHYLVTTPPLVCTSYLLSFTPNSWYFCLISENSQATAEFCPYLVDLEGEDFLFVGQVFWDQTPLAFELDANK